jgi:phosphotransferase system  glucose/maltose/N-acetylglucosamine-specific IIC component
MVEALFAPFAFFMAIMGALIGLVGLAATIYALYDIIFRQPAMERIEKLIWIIVILVFNIVGVLAYFLIVKYLDENPVSEAITTGREHRRINDLEELADLKERGVLTEDEFQREKERILGSESGENGADREDE